MTQNLIKRFVSVFVISEFFIVLAANSGLKKTKLADYIHTYIVALGTFSFFLREHFWRYRRLCTEKNSWVLYKKDLVAIINCRELCLFSRTKKNKQNSFFTLFWKKILFVYSVITYKRLVKSPPFRRHSFVDFF